MFKLWLPLTSYSIDVHMKAVRQRVMMREEGVLIGRELQDAQQRLAEAKEMDETLKREKEDLEREKKDLANVRQRRVEKRALSALVRSLWRMEIQALMALVRNM